MTLTLVVRVKESVMNCELKKLTEWLRSNILFYSFILYGSLAWQFTLKTNHNRVFILQRKCLPIITFSFFKDHSNPLFKGLKLLKLHEVQTRNTLTNFLIYIPRMSTSPYGNHSLRGDAFLWNKFFEDLTCFSKLKSFLMKRFLQTCENEL